METLLESQTELQWRIARTWENLKKTGQQNVTVDIVRTSMDLLEKRWTRLDEQHSILMRDHRAKLKDHDYIKNDFLGSTEAQYMLQRAQLLQLERQLLQKSAASQAEATATKPPTTKPQVLAGPAQAPAYPRIELPKFSGRFEDWPTFRDLFVSMVIDEPGLPDVRKLHYLKTSVLGEAESLVKNLPTTEENFACAWTSLKNHFENKRLLVRSYLNTFASLQKMRPNSISDLRRVFHGVMTTVGALKGIGRPITSSEDWFVHSVVNLLDQSTRREWDRTLLKSSEPPSFDDLHTFLKEQITSEEALATSQPEVYSRQPPRSGRTVRVAQQRPKQTNPVRNCPVCRGDHFIATCDQYLSKTPQGRKELVATHNRCYNCLGRHSVRMCNSMKNCQKCSGRHHSSLHEAFSPAPAAASEGASVHVTKHTTAERAAALLATVRLWVSDSLGREHPVRALIDPGSETSIISESLAQRLRLQRTPTSIAIYGIGGHQSGVARGRVTLTLSARDKNYAITVSSLVLPRLSAYSGSVTSDHSTWPHVQGLELADPEFVARDPVELLLGAEVYATIVMSGLRRGNKNDPVAQQTRLGWILLGGLGSDQTGPSVTSLHCTNEEDTATALRRFWEWEEPLPVTLPPTEEERQGEDHFCRTYQRLPCGRFQVRLPFRTPPSSQLALTRRAAQRMLDTMDRRFARDDDFRLHYQQFMQEYIDLQHMSPAPQTPAPEDGRLCYLPHHGIWKCDGDNRKMRVVFNGSARTASGTSLNDHLISGPNLLPSLPDVILRWRRHRYAFVADIEKMYRQIAVHPDDKDFQRILWRQDEFVAEFRLDTLTYGTACAPFLAIRVLRQLAQEEERNFPAGAAALRKDAYVDDILSGASTFEAGQQKQKELIALCMAGGFPLKKWAANHPGLLKGVPVSQRQTPSARAELPNTQHSVLGLRWHPEEDHLTVIVNKIPRNTPTKRIVLSQVARLFDPLGWLAPVVIRAKILIQTTWLQQLDWDAPLADQEATIWCKLLDELPILEDLRIPRWFKGLSETGQVQVHGFADASERAYGAVVYLRTVDAGEVHVSLVQAKSKVAPLKRVSLPRLELCAAALLAKLSAHVRSALELSTSPTYHWSDSTVTLAWIRAHPAKWTTFVANRVAEIQRESHLVQWRHVSGKDNPADCLSRGLSPLELADHPLWWHGPHFLRESSSAWPSAEDLPLDDDIPEERPIRCLAAKHVNVDPPEMTRFSNLRRLLRVTSWMLRWKAHPRKTEYQAVTRDFVLEPQELDASLSLWVRVSQGNAFARELKDIREGRAVHQQSPLKRLTPFLDRDGILRVGGRLRHALLDVNQRHPIILAPASHLSRLIVEAHHLRTLHGGTQATLASIRQRFWLPRGRQLVKGWIHHCPRCIRWRAASPQPIMSDLPAARVTPSRPFLHTGVDFAGPIRLRTTKGRGHRSYKAFLCIFICFSTRAVHLEVVTDYTTIAFLAAFRRFTSRRGIPVAIYSDRGTNFVGADSELRALFSGAAPDAKFLAGRLADEGIRWVFNPPAAPHFGGLWEAAVRSVKHHLRRVIGEATLTYEEMATLLAEVEACLNSRPLQALSDDPEDVTALTPGHFLVGEPLLAIPETRLMEVPANRLCRWRMLQQMRDHLWARWSQEYLQTLIPRPKWWKETGGLKEGQLCVIKDESSSPTRWPLARVVRLHRGKDAQVRVVELKTSTGTLTRPVVKLVPLPDTTISSE